MIHLLSNTVDLQTAFRRLAKKFDHIEIISAWLGNPKKGIPYAYLAGMKKIDVYAGISFDQTHPKGIEYIMKLKQCNLVLIEEPFTFHMKVYHFYNANESALIMGSSNFTLSGFTDNAESNIVLEGKTNRVIINTYLNEIKSQLSSFNKVNLKDEEWLRKYNQKYEARQRNLRESKVLDDSRRDEEIQNDLVWLRNGSWEDYMKEFNLALKDKSDNNTDFIVRHAALLNEYQTTLKLPWKASLFDDSNKRAMLLGTRSKVKNRDYGWLGHVGASGGYRKLLKESSIEKITTICSSINSISKLSNNFKQIEIQKHLETLEATGSSIKVWGRALAIIHPDKFFTISSEPVRQSLSILLKKPKSHFTQVEGYIYLLKIIYQSPWFNSPEPKDKIEKLVWQNRCAFLDVIFRS